MINWLEASGLERDHCGTPETLHWLVIRPNGTMTVCQSDNRIAYLRGHDLWWQWRLDRDLHREIDPFSRGPCQPITWSLAIPTERHGVVVVARHDTGRPDNPIATAMLGAVGIDYQVRGSAAWLCERDPDSGLHRDLNGSQLRELRTVAAHCRV